ncbi:CoA-substrate-specific enzyme activase, putative [Sporobacter termitidis DSM 10068]|uniref:CoA-substrate-specific enzyme activase, putative n=1 Tax=Sporobacter termitidis DSM 10068 TaxID=1123282 RepID=A0A1M5XEV5_9FIRM|nr:2-hydroxyacyl-CoA dehydratase [Sporobacter termitidis]SHH97733.1 CoA-substrate-specific enzyme activase, putative [Sporobacter termitidis DSM 10068]
MQLSLENLFPNIAAVPPVVGIDIGSRAAKGALIYGNALYLTLSYTGVNMQQNAEEVLNDLLTQAGLNRRDVAFLVGTGYGRIAMKFSEFPVQIQTEIFCHALGAHALCPDISTVIDIGGQDSKVIAVGRNGAVMDFVMNDKCAAGTGRFLEKAAEMLSVPLETMGELSLQSTNELIFSSQCIVFAESELISMKARGTSTPDIAAGIHRAVAKRILGLYSRFDNGENVLFTGGVSQNIGMRRALEEVLHCHLAEPRVNAVYAGAIGAAVFAGRFLNSNNFHPDSIEKQAVFSFGEMGQSIERKMTSYIDGSEKRKKIGYLCTYTPMELMHAAGASYMRLLKSGTAEQISSGEQLTRSVYCDFVKSILGAFREKDPLYSSLDGVYNFYTCDCTKRVGEAILAYYKDADTFVLPRYRHNADSYEFLNGEFRFFAETLERLTGNGIEPSKLRESIRLYNSIRAKLREISELRKSDPPLLTGGEFYTLMRGYFYLDPEEYLALCTEALGRLKTREVQASPKTRVFLSGGIHADGDMRLIEVLENELDIVIVAEDHCTGLKSISFDIDENEEPFQALAKGYIDKAPCARMKPLTDSMDFSLRLAKEYRADAVVYSYVKFCPSYGQTKHEFVRRFHDKGYPVLDIGLDYSKNDYGQLRTRLETFITMVKNRGGLHE